MQKVVSAVAVAALSQTSVDALSTGAHPFVGENRGATVIESDTRTTHKAEKVPAYSSKYEQMINTDSYGRYKNSFERMQEYLFGESQDQIRLEQAIESLKHTDTRNTKYGRGRLGDIKRFPIQSPQLTDIYSLSLKIPPLFEGYAIIDTATDLFAI